MMDNIKKQKFLGIILTLFIFVLVLSGCSNKNTTQSSHEINVVTTTDFYAEVAKKVVGDKGKVTSIIDNPAIDPHDYEPTTRVAQKVGKANITVANGLGYDSWMDKLDKGGSYIKLGEDVMHKKTGDNPHIWYKPETMPDYATYLADKLGKKYPKDKIYFKQNAQEYIDSLKPVQTEINKLKVSSSNLSNKDVYVTEPVFDYSIQATGFKVANKKFEAAVEKGTDSSPAVIHEMQEGIKHKRVAFLVFNTQTDSKIVNNLVDLAKKNNIPVLDVTETLPKDKTYKQWMLSQYQSLNKILQSERK